MHKIYLVVLLLLASISVAVAEVSAKIEKPAYLDTNLAFEQRAVDLVSRMTLQEKTDQMNHAAPELKRLGIPAYNWWNECLHGIWAPGFTNFPQAIGMASSWDTDMIKRVSTAISDEARASSNESIRKGQEPVRLDFWTPNINIFRDPRWGRGQECYGEDPYLTSRMAVNFVNGLQGDDPRHIKCVATPKHYAVHSGPEGLRHEFDAKCSMHDLWDTYLPAFETCIKEGGAFSVMGAYNRVNGSPCCANSFLLEDILRKKWGFKGYVVSDCGAIENIWGTHKVEKGPEEAAAAAVKAGCDLACIASSYLLLPNSVAKGLLTEADIDKSVTRLMLARMKLGMFDPPEMVKYSKIPASVIRSKKHLDLSLEAARKSIVLLKNDGLLPLNKTSIKKIAVVGSSATIPQIGNYAEIQPTSVTILQGLKDKIGADRIVYSKGCSLGVSPITPIPSSALSPGDGMKHGLSAEYYPNIDLAGTPSVTRIDENVDFNWTAKSPAPGLSRENFSVRWTGKLTAPANGRYLLGVTVDDAYRLYLDGKPISDCWGPMVGMTRSSEVDLEAGKSYDIRLEYFQTTAEAVIQLCWLVPGGDEQMVAEAVTVAKDCDAIVVALGIPSGTELRSTKDQPVIAEDELCDRADIVLPAGQQKLLEAICNTGKPVVLVLTGGSAKSVVFAQEHASAIMETWFAGERGGTAIADVLFGEFNPSGRLPVTSYSSLNDVPDMKDYSMENRTYRYFKGTPLYPFGFGLSYTTYAYSNLKLANNAIKAGDNLTLSVEVSNTGKRAGDEIVQLYLTDTDASSPVPIRKLVGFQRVSLAPGQKKVVKLTITPELMSFVDKDGNRILEPGEFKITLGGSQGDDRSRALGASDVLRGKFTVSGDTCHFD